MEVTGLSLTTITLFLPLIGLAILVFMNGETQKSNLKWVAFVTSLVTFVASVVMWINFDPANADLQMVQRNTWAEVSLGDSVINVSYFVGVDGISVLLVLLTTFIMPIAILGSFGEQPGDGSATLDADAPMVRIDGLAVLGSVEVNCRRPGESKKQARRRLKREKKDARRARKLAEREARRRLR